MFSNPMDLMGYVYVFTLLLGETTKTTWGSDNIEIDGVIVWNLVFKIGLQVNDKSLIYPHDSPCFEVGYNQSNTSKPFIRTLWDILDVYLLSTDPGPTHPEFHPERCFLQLGFQVDSSVVRYM